MSGFNRWLARGLAIVVVTSGVVLVTVALTGREAPINRSVEVPRLPKVVRDQPPRIARPIHLGSTYVAPRRAPRLPMGRVLLRRLGIAAPVVQVGWDDHAMAVPDDPATLGWFGPSAAQADRAGVSLIAGHVSDQHDRAGPLARLVQARVGDVIEWRIGRAAVRFRVVTIQRYPRAVGLPTSLFRVDGPHVLRLVTCTDRRSSVFGFHYADNLVVSALQISP